MARQAVPLVALDRQNREVAADLRDAFERVTSASAFTLGGEVEAFEREFAAFCGARHCVGVASGTAALAVGLQAAGIGRGSEVIVPAHTFIATALGVVHAGATPVFCDVERGTGLLDVASAAEAVTPRTAAIVPVHLYGQVGDMPAINALAKRHGLLVFEDAAQAHGAEYEGGRAGSLGDAAAFSFYPTKNLGALGDGGAICTDDAQLAQRARALRHLGQLRKGEHTLMGWNERLDGLQAAFLRAKLPHVNRWNSVRRERAEMLRQRLAGRVGLLTERPETSCIYHLFPIRLDDRNLVARELHRRGVRTGVHYSPTVPDQPPFVGLARRSHPNAAAWAAQELSLPMFEHMTIGEADAVATACLEAL